MGIEGFMKIGLAVKDVDETVKTLAGALGLSPEETVTYEPYGMKYCMIHVGEDSYIEVIQPTDSQGPIARFIKTHGEGLQHLSFRVTNLEKTMALLKEKGVRFLQETPLREDTSIGIAKYVFLSPRQCHGVLVQLMEISET
jgi:methylmalonyl-CoA/ethylmalonyl-CoA epimerase